jgi:hypothetical protein
MATDAATTASGTANKVVETTLRLRADGGNSAVADQLFQQVTGAVHKAFQEVEQVGGQLVSKANGWVKSAADATGPMWNRVVEDAKQANSKVSSGLKQAADSYHKVEAAAAKTLQPLKTIATYPIRLPLVGARGTSESHQSVGEHQESKAASGEKEKSTSEAFSATGSHAFQFAKSFALLTAPNEKIAEERKKTFEKIENAYGLVEHGVGLFGGAKKVAGKVSGVWTAAKSGKQVVGAAGVATEATGAAPVAAEAVEGVGAVEAAGAGPAGLGAGGMAAVIAGGVVAGTLAVDAFKKIANWSGLLGTHFETTTGAVIEWYQAIKRNAEVEKQITGLEEAHKAYQEQMKERQAQTRAYYEARDRIDESQAHVQEAARLEPVAGQYEKRFAEAGNAGTPRELELQQRQYAREDRQLLATTYTDRFRAKQQELHDAVNAANATQADNVAHPTRATAMFLGQPVVHDNKIDSEGQKKIDEQEAEYVPEGFWHGMGKRARWLGSRVGLVDSEEQIQARQDAAVAQQAKDLKENNPLAGLEKGANGWEHKVSDGSVPVVTAEPVDLHPQLMQQEHALKLANELRDVARERTTQLQNQLQTMAQQVSAAQQQKALSEQQVKAEQDRLISQKANMSMLSHEQQSSAANILKKFNATKHLSRDDALTLQKLGITQGAIGKEINATLARGLDPELAKQFKTAGGEEELDKAQQRLTESTSDLADAQAQAKKTLQEFREALGQWKKAAATASSAEDAVESTRSKIGGYADPTGGRGARGIIDHTETEEQRKIENAGKEFAGAIREIGDSFVSSFQGAVAELRATAQRIKQGQT